MTHDELLQVLDFLRAAESLKTVVRSGWTSADERRDLLTLVAALPAVPREEIVALWDEYEAGVTPEARLAKGLDKLETILQHTQGKNPRDFDYRFNLDYGRRYAEGHPLLAELRAILDEATERRAREAAQDD
ncbi:MAG: HD domain-containing protein [Gemmatimonadetes bacterium]|jgi:putative hydrolase of HD superfamily|nr:HD domain-containing protein [Gemmatimonadota bacterium]